MSTSKPENSAGKTLRWWPAAMVVVFMALLRKLPDTMEAPSLPVFMAGFMGPAVLGMFILVWWLFASRASWKEKLIGFLAVGVIGVVASALCHFTMKDMGLMFFVVPYGLAAFAIPLILLANQPALRLPVALLSALSSVVLSDGWTMDKRQLLIEALGGVAIETRGLAHQIAA